MFEIAEISVADTRRMFQYVQSGIYGAKLNIKGFDYAWIMSRRDWSRSDRVLDVGAGYSHLPIHLGREIGCEVWCVDDFGLNSGDDFWTRGEDPRQFIKEHPEVKYVLERVGDQDQSSLPSEYFNVVYSASALEHAPPEMTRSIWRHLASLTKPGGEMIHALDIRLPVSRGILSALKAMLIDRVYPLLPSRYKYEHAFYTPLSYARLATGAVGIRGRLPRRRLDVLRFVLDPEIVVEPFEATFNRIVRDGMVGKRHLRVGSLLIHLRKLE